jgi:hypothetical protein
LLRVAGFVERIIADFGEWNAGRANRDGTLVELGQSIVEQRDIGKPVGVSRIIPQPC